MFVHILFISTLFSYSQGIYFVSSFAIDMTKDSFVIREDTVEGDKNDIYNVILGEDSMCIREVAENEFQNDFMKRKHKNFLFYIHGYGKSLEDVIKRAVEMQQAYDVYVIFFYWPYKQPSGRKSNLFESHRNIENSMKEFRYFLTLQSKLQHNCSKSNYTLLAHSLGNYFLKFFPGYQFNDNSNFWFNNVILNSAAVNTKGHEKWLSKLNIQDHIYVISNKHDFVLSGLQLFTRAKLPLGKRIVKERVSSVQYIDVSDIVGFRRPVYKTHSYFTGDILMEEHEIKNMYMSIINSNILNQHPFILESKLQKTE